MVLGAVALAIFWWVLIGVLQLLIETCDPYFTSVVVDVRQLGSHRLPTCAYNIANIAARLI